MMENQNADLQNEFEHDDISDLKNSGDLYADTVPEKEGKEILKRIKNVLERKKAGNSVSIDYSTVEQNDDYKNFLNASFQKEKQTAPDKEARLYFMILGIDEGVLSFNEFGDKSYMKEYQSFFSDATHVKKDGHIVSTGGEKKNWTREDVRVWRKFLSPEKEMVISDQGIKDKMSAFHSEFIQKEKIALVA